MKTEIALTHVIEAVASVGEAVEAIVQHARVIEVVGYAPVPLVALLSLKEAALSLRAALDNLGVPPTDAKPSRAKAH